MVNGDVALPIAVLIPTCSDESIVIASASASSSIPTEVNAPVVVIAPEVLTTELPPIVPEATVPSAFKPDPPVTPTGKTPVVMSEASNPDPACAPKLALSLALLI